MPWFDHHINIDKNRNYGWWSDDLHVVTLIFEGLGPRTIKPLA
jgi:hypothetical protein